MQVYAELRDDTKNDEDEGEVLPPLEKGEQLKLVRKKPSQHFTQPPPRYTEATLVRTLEELGIGRPSTYAPVVETIQRRGYVVRRGKTLYPTELGLVVDDLLRDNFPDIISAEFTAQMEAKLDQIEEGAVEWERVLSEFYHPFRQEVSRAEEMIHRLRLDEEEVTDEECPQCGRNMVVKTGRYGRFLACPGFPACRQTKPFLETTGHVCPKCGGQVVVRRTKKGKVFFGCAEYPACDFVTWDQPTEEKCPQCSAFLVKKAARKNATYMCANPECGFKERKAGGGDA
jgi:DNA topoisomerase-1